MKIEISVNVDEENIKNIVEKTIADQIVEHYSDDCLRYGSTVSRGIKEGMDKVVKDMLYAHKDEIIDRVVERASVEMVRKGMPKLIEKFGACGEI